MTAWLYLVVSTSAQEDTLEDQARWGQGVADANGWEVTRTFSGVSSGKLGTRKLLDDLLKDLRALPKTQRPARILMLRVDRLGRGDGLDTIAAMSEIRKLGPILHTRDHGDLSMRRAADALLPAITAITAGIENEVRRDKSKAFHARARDRGQHIAPAPYGMTKDEHGHLVPLEPQASFVRRAFEMRAAGAGARRIGVALAAEAPWQAHGNGRPRRFSGDRTRVAYMLQNRNYRGTVVDEELWDRVQDVKLFDFKDRMKQRFPWPLGGGIVHCWCGRAISGQPGGSPKKRIRYYVCTEKQNHLNERPARARAESLEGQFAELLGKLAASPEFDEGQRLRAPRTDVPALREALRLDRAALESTDARRRAAWDLQADGRIAAGELAARLDQLAAERTELEARIVTTERSLAVGAAQATLQRTASEALGRAASEWMTWTTEDQRAVARLVAGAVEGLFLTREGKLVTGLDRREPDVQFHVEPSSSFLAHLHLPWLTELERAIAHKEVGPG